MGFFDYHFHGCAGVKTIALERKGYETISTYLKEKGETDRFLAAFSAAPIPNLIEALEFCGSLMASGPLPGAQLKGVYLEGPFVRIAGGMTSSLLARPTLAGAKELMRAGKGIIKNVTIAPELPGALEVIEYFASEGVNVSAGHFSCTPELLKEAVNCGVSAITHFGNNCEGPLLCEEGVYHTDGPFLEILADDRLTVEMICDGVHVDLRLVKAVYRVKGREKFLPVTDGCAATGLPGKRLSFPDPAGTVSEFDVKNGALYIADTNNLTGSLATMKKIYANLTEKCGIPEEDALYMCSGLPETRI